MYPKHTKDILDILNKIRTRRLLTFKARTLNRHLGIFNIYELDIF